MTLTRGADCVLLIDDDRMSREVLALLLASEGYHVECAESGESALRWLRGTNHSVSVVLSDVQMPGLAGAELSTALRGLCGAQTVLLAMSGSEVSQEMGTAFDGFLLKPFRVRELAETVSRCRAIGCSSASTETTGTASAGVQTSNHGMNKQEQNGGTSQDSTAGRATDALLDERIYRQLREAISEPQVQQMYGMCIEDVRRRIGEMRHHAEARQADQFARQAHAIKGGCGMLGASELYRMAADLERTGIPTAEPESTPSVNPLDELAAACDRLERILATRI